MQHESDNHAHTDVADALPPEVNDRVADALEASIDDAVSRFGDDADADIDVSHRERGARLRTNIQVGSASERVNVTEELYGKTLADLVVRLDTYREVIGEQVSWASAHAKEVNRDA